MNIENFLLNFEFERDLSRRDAEFIRGYLGNLFREKTFLHHHKTDGGYLYKYPCVQCKIIENHCLIIGFNEGIEIIKKVFLELYSVNIKGKVEEILSEKISWHTEDFSLSDQKIFYTFLTPWLALNEKNYSKFIQMKSLQQKKALLENILIGNILSISKSLGYTVPDLLKAEIQFFKEIFISFKNVRMLGFYGNFFINFNIPNFWGLGKSVSRGFGTVIKQQPN